MSVAGMGSTSHMHLKDYDLYEYIFHRGPPQHMKAVVLCLVELKGGSVKSEKLTLTSYHLSI